MMKMAAVLACALLTACGAPGSLFGPASTMPTLRDERMSVQDAGRAVTVGKSTRAEVAALLGPATVVRFDSGYEVWVYRIGKETKAQERSEFVLLFSPAGVLTKMRERRPAT